MIYHKNFVRFVLSSALLFFAFSCMVPTTKESYLHKFDQFVNQVQKEHENYTRKDWKWADSQFEKYSKDWYDEYKDNLSLKEKLHVKMIILKYKSIKGEEQLDSDLKEMLKEDANEIRDKIEEYIENDADEDLEELKRGLEAIGDSAVKVFEDVIESLRKKED